MTTKRSKPWHASSLYNWYGPRPQSTAPVAGRVCVWEVLRVEAEEKEDIPQHMVGEAQVDNVHCVGGHVDDAHGR